ncbi:MAG: SDR family oxidoreductase [Deltaproteobacteria bacterium]|nr:SDR family oxidoreductase [Deltaproteobacteria bacterium]
MDFPKYPDLGARSALVTGASSGIGLGIAAALLEQGMRVVLHYRSGFEAAEALARKYPGRAVPVHADLGTDEGCTALAHKAKAAFPDLSLLVHSAGIWNAGPIGTLTRAALDEIFRVNTFSAFSLMRELAGTLGAQGNGAAVFIGSTAGQRGEAKHSHYAASKGALQSMVLSLAVELAPAVRVNLVSPGWVRTPMAEGTLARVGSILEATMPNKRVAEIADVTNAVLFLASQASGHLIGEDLGVSGGALLFVPRGQVAPVER